MGSPKLKAGKQQTSSKPRTTQKLVGQKLESIAKKYNAKSGGFFFIEVDGHKFKAPKRILPKVFTQGTGKIVEVPTTTARTRDLTTQEVADLLNVSRPFVAKLIDSGELEGFKVGNQRRVRKADAMAYRIKMRKKQNKALDELAEEAEDLGLDW